MRELIWSFDVSTTNVGISLWDSNGKLLELKHLSLKIDKTIPNEDRDLFKAQILKNYLIKSRERIKDEYNGDIIHNFIEAPLQNTPKNINTTALLLGFNGIARYILFEMFGFPPVKITVHDSRKIFCNEFVKSVYRKGENVDVLSFPKGWKNDNKKEYIRKKVEYFEPEINWFYTRTGKINDMSYDMSDSYCVGVCGLILLNIIKLDDWIERNNKCVKNMSI
jgi:hypothetical protein